MHKDVLKLVGFNLLVLLVLFVVYSSGRLYLMHQVNFPWYDLDIYFLLIIPCVLCLFIVNWLTAVFDRYFALQTDKIIGFKSVTITYFAAALSASQFMLDRYSEDLIEIEHPAQISQLKNDRYFDINPNQMKYTLPYGLLYHQYIQPRYRFRSFRNSNTMIQKAYFVFKIKDTDNKIWWGKTYTDRFNRHTHNQDEKLSEFLAYVKRDINFNIPDGAYFFTSESYLKDKKEYLKAIQLQYPEFKMDDVTVLELGVPDFSVLRELSLFALLTILVPGMFWLIIQQRKCM